MLEMLAGETEGSVQPFTGDISSALRDLAPREQLYSLEISSNEVNFFFSFFLPIFCRCQLSRHQCIFFFL